MSHPQDPDNKTSPETVKAGGSLIKIEVDDSSPQALFDSIQQNWRNNVRTLGFLKTMLDSLIFGIAKNEIDLLCAVSEDLEIDQTEAYRVELLPTVMQLKLALENIQKW